MEHGEVHVRKHQVEGGVEILREPVWLVSSWCVRVCCRANFYSLMVEFVEFLFRVVVRGWFSNSYIPVSWNPCPPQGASVLSALIHEVLEAGEDADPGLL